MAPPEHHNEDHQLPPQQQNVSIEKLSFPLRLAIQAGTLFIMGAAFIVRIEGKISNLEEKLQAVERRLEARDNKDDAIHATTGADLSNYNTRITVLERAAEYENANNKPRYYGNRESSQYPQQR